MQQLIDTAHKQASDAARLMTYTACEVVGGTAHVADTGKPAELARVLPWRDPAVRAVRTVRAGAGTSGRGSAFPNGLGPHSGKRGATLPWSGSQASSS
ncbi:hypothetical protein GCM10023079_01130 [Streptomyces chitinivorans]